VNSVPQQALNSSLIGEVNIQRSPVLDVGPQKAFLSFVRIGASRWWMIRWWFVWFDFHDIHQGPGLQKRPVCWTTFEIHAAIRPAETATDAPISNKGSNNQPLLMYVIQ
jgi:hypothetical protein